MPRGAGEEPVPSPHLAPRVGEPPGLDDVDRPPAIYGPGNFRVRMPLVFVPGILGSQIDVTAPGKLSPEQLWPPSPKLAWPPISLYGDHGPLSLLADPKRTKTASMLLPFVYDPLIKFLGTIGYSERNGNLLVFPYNWTQSNDVSGGQLAEAIRAFLKGHPGKKAGVLNHSMGGIVTRSAIVNHGAGDLIDRTMYLASPHYGAVKAYTFIKSEMLPDTDWFMKSWLASKAYSWVRHPTDPDELKDVLKRMLLSIPSVYELLPDNFYLNGSHAMVEKPPGPSLTNINDIYFGVEASRIGADYQGLARNALQFKRNLGGSIPGEHILLFSKKHDTLDCATQHPLPWGWEFKDTGQHGDGTVPADSARALGSGSAAKCVTGNHSELPNHE